MMKSVQRRQWSWVNNWNAVDIQTFTQTDTSHITRGEWLTVISMDYMDMDLGKEGPGDTGDSAYMVMDIHKSNELNESMDYMEMEINTIGNTSQESLLGKYSR